MIGSKKVIEALEMLLKYCNEQEGCQNCILRKHGCDHWDCHINAFRLEYEMNEIKGQAEAKKRNHGFI